MKKLLLGLTALGIICPLLFLEKSKGNIQISVTRSTTESYDAYPLSLSYMRKKSYPGSVIKTQQVLDNGSNYTQSIVSYTSDGLTIYALLTIPQGPPPKGGWPAIVFNHGYIPPQVYRTTQRYVSYVDAFARNGYVVIKSDYRGNGNSEGGPEGAYFSSSYTTDVLNAISSLKKLNVVNPQKIGMWGHSMGGNITLRTLEISKDIQAAVIWSGVVGSYSDLLYRWRRSVPFQPSQRESFRNSTRSALLKAFGDPTKNPLFWDAIDPTFHLNSITTPIQLHHGTADEEVPLSFSTSLFDSLSRLNKPVELYTYDGAGHNISEPSFDLAIKRSIQFFDRYLQ